MSEVLGTAWTVAVAGWRASWNRSFRFSRAKSAFIFLALQAVFLIFITRRVPVMTGGATAESLGGLAALMAMQMGWFGLMSGFSGGQVRLYRGVLVPLFQIAPARPLGYLLGRVLEEVPNQVWSCLLFAFAFSGAVPGPARWGTMALLVVAGMLAGTAAHLTGLLVLAFWSRYSPRTLNVGGTFFGIGMLSLVTATIIFLSRGGTITQVALELRHYRQLALCALLVLVGLPGLSLLIALVVRPRAVEDLYRQGVYQVLELEETSVARPDRSVWLTLPDGVSRAVLAREWLVLARSALIRIQGLVWLAGTIGVYFAGVAMRVQSPARQIAFVAGFSLFAWFLPYGNLVIRAFQKEGRAILLYRLTGVPVWKLVAAKLASVLGPSALLVTVTALVGAFAARLGAGQALALLGWTLGGLLAGTLGGFGMAAATSGEDEDQELVEGPPRDGEAPQPTGSWWVLARLGALLLTAALPVWTGAACPGLAWKPPLIPLLALDALLPLLLLAGGIWLMTKIWEAHS